MPLFLLCCVLFLWFQETLCFSILIDVIFLKPKIAFRKNEWHICHWDGNMYLVSVQCLCKLTQITWQSLNWNFVVVFWLYTNLPMCFLFWSSLYCFWYFNFDLLSFWFIALGIGRNPFYICVSGSIFCSIRAFFKIVFIISVKNKASFILQFCLTYENGLSNFT